MNPARRLATARGIRRAVLSSSRNAGKGPQASKIEIMMMHVVEAKWRNRGSQKNGVRFANRTNPFSKYAVMVGNASTREDTSQNERSAEEI